MKLEKQVVSLSLAKRLKELGVKQDSLYWYTLPEGKYVEKFMSLNPAYQEEEFAPTKVQLTVDPDFYGNYGEPVTKASAFTVAEVGEMLPQKTCWRGYSNNGGKWGLEFGDFRAEAATEADARGKMLCYLLENKLINLI
jgi:hypothetical protein